MSETRRHRILIVDDERDNVEFLSRIFRREFEVEHAADATEALARIKDGRFDVIITDQMMPGMSGVELLRRSLDLSPDAIRIVITGFPDLEMAINSVNRGRAFRFFTKPLDREELYTAVSQALRASEVAAASRRVAVELAVSGTPAVSATPSPDVERLIAARTVALTREIERLRERLERDGDVGVLAERVLRDRLDEEIARAQRFGLPLSLVLVRVAPTPPRSDLTPSGRSSSNPYVAPLRGVAEALMRDASRYDLVGRAGDDLLGLALPHTDATGAAARIARLEERMTGSRFIITRVGRVTLSGETSSVALWDAALTTVALGPV